MAVKAESIEQFDGFGNLVPKTIREHFRSSGFTPSAQGMVAGRRTFVFTSGDSTTFPQFTTFNGINMFADGYGRVLGVTGGSNSTLFGLSNNGEIWASASGTGTPYLSYPTHTNGSHFGSGGLGGLISDQKNRLLFPGQRYLGMFDPSLTDTVVTVDFTNGSTALVASGGSFTPGMAGKLFYTYIGSQIYYYRLNAYTDATHMSMYSAFTPATQTSPILVLLSWTEQWKDFGATYTTNNEGNTAFTPTERYEDTVLFLRGNKVTTLNTVTDTVTTDASPAFTLPTGFDGIAIHKGSNGLLIASNFQRKGVIILWDNFSDRSIAPWIELQDRIISVCKYNDNWIVITTREILYTNGYSITPLINSFLNSNVTVFASSLYPQTSLVAENQLYCTLGVTYNGKRRAGIYKINMDNKLATFMPSTSMDQITEKTRALYYAPGTGTGKIHIGTNASWDYLGYDAEPLVASFITNPLGKGDNYKHAEALKVNLGISDSYYTKDSPFSFTITAKVCAMDRQLFNTSRLKTAMVDYTSITVDETVYFNASTGDEVEFLAGSNAGYSRNITAISGSGTATAVYTLDRALPTLDTVLTNNFFVTPFQLIKSKTYTNVTATPEVWFDIKNKIKGKKFMIKIDIESATVPLELRPMLFVYDDLGVL